MIILIIGLPGSGKTALAKDIVGITNWEYVSCEEIEDQVQQATKAGEISRSLSNNGKTVVADVSCSTKLARESFGQAHFTIWVDKSLGLSNDEVDSLRETLSEKYYDLRIRKGLSFEQERDACLSRIKDEIATIS